MLLARCKQCGREVAKDAWVCSHCGCAQPTENTSQVEPAADRRPAAPTPGEPRPAEFVAPLARARQSAPGSGEVLPSGNDPAVLDQIVGWNWGAYSFNWIWALAHRARPLWPLALAAWLFGGLPGLGFAIYLGHRGNEVAWFYRPFRNVEEFWEVQRAWRPVSNGPPIVRRSR